MIILFLTIIIFLLIIRLYSLKRMNRVLELKLKEKEMILREKVDVIGLEGLKLDTILDNMVEGVLVIDSARRILLMNPSLKNVFLVNFAPEGRSVVEVIRNASIQEIIERVFERGERLVSREVTVLYPKERILRINGASISKDNYILGAIFVFHDITELRTLERIRREFVSNVSHELRTPLCSIKGYAETLLDGAIEDKEISKDFIGIIHKESSRLAKLIDDLLNLSKIESDKMKLDLVPVDLLEIIRHVVFILETQAKERAISINIDAKGESIKVLGDENRLSQVVFNLLDNAIKYNKDGGGVLISISCKDRFAQVDISDTGIGIPEKDLPRIFERFYRVDKSRSRELGGTGLGLSIVKHIVEAHGGIVRVQSTQNVGSTFSFTIPLA